MLAGLVAVSAFGNLSYFGAIKVPHISWMHWGRACWWRWRRGVAGGLFARLLVASLTGARMLAGHDELSPLYTLLKFIATWLTAWCGVPGGIFAPALSIGAGIGNAFAQLADPGLGAALIAMGFRWC